MKLLLKYFVTVAVPGLIQFFGTKYVGAETAMGVGLAVGTAGARALHVSDPPAKP